MTPPFDFYLSNSKMRAYESMCPVEWKAQYLDNNPLYQWVESDAMHYGNVFESMVVGKGIHGFVAPNEKLKKSTYYERLKDNAEKCRGFLRNFGGRVKEVQKHIRTTAIDASGRTIFIEGTLDILYQFNDSRWCIIDLKFTGDVENTFGSYQFGDEEKLDPSQALQYMLLFWLTTQHLPEWYYWVFDKKRNSTPKFIQVEADETSMAKHIERLSKAYHEIIECMTTNVWKPQPKYSRCAKCKVKCDQEHKIPEIIKIQR